MKIEHIGIAVKSLKDSNALFEALLGAPPYKMEEVASEQVTTSFFRAGDSKIELLEATGAGSAIARFLEKKGEGIHHIAFATDDIYATMQELKQKGFMLLSDEPKGRADNKLIVFVHPKSSNGVLVEFCQEVPLSR